MNWSQSVYQQNSLTLSCWIERASENNLKILLILTGNKIWYFIQIVSKRENLNLMWSFIF